MNSWLVCVLSVRLKSFLFRVVWRRIAFRALSIASLFALVVTIQVCLSVGLQVMGVGVLGTGMAAWICFVLRLMTSIDLVPREAMNVTLLVMVGDTAR